MFPSQGQIKNSYYNTFWGQAFVFSIGSNQNYRKTVIQMVLIYISVSCESIACVWHVFRILKPHKKWNS